MSEGKTSSHKPFLIAWNLTRQCNLRCGHCYMDADETFQTSLNPPLLKGEIGGLSGGLRGISGGGESGPEITLEEGFRLIDEIASVNPDTILVLTGGEPLLYKHTIEFARYASTKGLMVVVGTNGLLLDDTTVKRLRESGVSGVGLSLDSLDPAQHDSFRGLPGAWKRTVDAIGRCRRHGLQFQIHNSVTSFNWREVPQIVEFAHQQGARVVNFFFMVCTGRGEELTDITPEQYEEVLSTLIDLQGKYPGMLIRARCAPHFKRTAYQKDPHSPITKAEGYLGGGCLAGSHYCRIAPDGEITPCPYMSLSVGNVRSDRFSQIWEDAPVFKELRSPQLKGKCGVCEYEDLCGGCRARPYASHGDYLDEDLWCQYVPRGGAKIGATTMNNEKNRDGSDKGKRSWTKEAEERLNRLPFFLRGMIRGNVEKYAEEHGITEITPELMDELRRKRFGDQMPGMPEIPEGNPPVPPFNKRGEFPWTKEAQRRLEAVPEFMRGMFKEAVEEFARKGGHLEVNVEVWERVEEVYHEDNQKSEARSKMQDARSEKGGEGRIEWTEESLQEIEGRYSNRPQFVKDFIVELIKEDIEKAALAGGLTLIEKKDLETIEAQGTAAVEWSEEAWKRLQKAPDFIRSGIKKAAERRASRMGIPLITPELLTEFRNMAMMKAVKRIKALGYKELTFDAFDYAKENIKKIRENKEAQERLDEIREYVTSKGKIGVIDKDMLNKMKEYLNG
ncbi:MAG: radical SAM protein [Nitrospirae bacterium]|nr:radical SAM protein [Nitrospirota bacterium]